MDDPVEIGVKALALDYYPERARAITRAVRSTCSGASGAAQELNSRA